MGLSRSLPRVPGRVACGPRAQRGQSQRTFRWTAGAEGSRSPDRSRPGTGPHRPPRSLGVASGPGRASPRPVFNIPTGERAGQPHRPPSRSLHRRAPWGPGSGLPRGPPVPASDAGQELPPERRQLGAPSVGCLSGGAGPPCRRLNGDANRTGTDLTALAARTAAGLGRERHLVVTQWNWGAVPCC